jgi:phosphoribosylanthranilate isomerase
MHKIHIKICGITNFTDAQVAVEAGADLLGFILYAKSPRYVAPETVAELIRGIRDWVFDTSTGIPNPQFPIPKFVGVFVNEPVEQVAEILSLTKLDYAQFHGDETPAMMQPLAGRGYKALRPANAQAAQTESTRFAPLGTVSGPTLMIDAYDPHAYGGTGQKADWHAAAAIARQHPGLLLAGGLTPANVAAAIRLVQPWGVDVSSGVEAAPGRKDHGKVRAFIEAARGG